MKSKYKLDVENSHFDFFTKNSKYQHQQQM